MQSHLLPLFSPPPHIASNPGRGRACSQARVGVDTKIYEGLKFSIQGFLGSFCRYRKALFFWSLGISLYLELFCFLSFITIVLRNLCSGTHRKNRFLGGRKIWQVFFSTDLSRAFGGIQNNNWKVGGSAHVSQPRSSAIKVKKIAHYIVSQNMLHKVSWCASKEALFHLVDFSSIVLITDQSLLAQKCPFAVVNFQTRNFSMELFCLFVCLSFCWGRGGAWTCRDDAHAKI